MTKNMMNVRSAWKFHESASERPRLDEHVGHQKGQRLGAVWIDSPQARGLARVSPKQLHNFRTLWYPCDNVRNESAQLVLLIVALQRLTHGIAEIFLTLITSFLIN